MALIQLSVECDKCGGWWDVVVPSKAEAERRQVKCPCGKRFSLSQGILSFFLSDNLFVAYQIRGSWHEKGNIDIHVGQCAKVKFKRIPERVFEVSLFPHGKAKVESSEVTKEGFLIISSNVQSRKTTSTRVGWIAFGEAKDHHMIPWRQALADSKGYELQRDSNMQVVTAETAFELFVDDLLSTHLKLGTNSIRWVQRRSIEEKVSVWYREAMGEGLPTQFKQEYSQWQRDAKEVRDSIVHRRGQSNLQQGKAAFKAVLCLISRMDPKWFLSSLN
jgi:hypothetical protein